MQGFDSPPLWYVRRGGQERQWKISGGFSSMSLSGVNHVRGTVLNSITSTPIKRSSPQQHTPDCPLHVPTSIPSPSPCPTPPHVPSPHSTCQPETPNPPTYCHDPCPCPGSRTQKRASHSAWYWEWVCWSGLDRHCRLRVFSRTPCDVSRISCGNWNNGKSRGARDWTGVWESGLRPLWCRRLFRGCSTTNYGQRKVTGVARN